MEGESDDRMENGKKRRRNGEERGWGGWREIKKEEINKRKKNFLEKETSKLKHYFDKKRDFLNILVITS